MNMGLSMPPGHVAPAMLARRGQVSLGIAASTQEGPDISLPYLACMLATANYYHLPPRVLPSIQAVEGGYPGAVHVNTDGSTDLGVMQINTRWVAPLADYVTRVAGTPTTVQQTRARLLLDPCFNIAAAGLIVRYEWTQSGHDWPAAVGNYHSHTADLHRAYLARVMAKARILFERGG
jgi:hypothetical protein